MDKSLIKQFNQTIEQQLVFIDSETEKVMAIYIQHPEKIMK